MEYTLPSFDQIPNVGLYLEQVTRYLNEYLEPLGCAALTGSMISNYVKKGLVKNPVKKQYTREHIAQLLVIAVTKTVLSLEEIQQLITIQEGKETQEMYADFCCTFLSQLEAVFRREALPCPKGRLMEDTLLVVAHKLYLDKCFGVLTV